MVTMTSADNALKSVYLGAVSEQLDTAINPLLAKIQRSTADVWGKEVRRLAQYGVNGGVGAGTEEGDLPSAAGNNYEQFVITLKNLYGTIEISDKAVRASENNVGAFVNLLNAEMDGLIRSSAFNFGRMLFGDGSGAMVVGKGEGRLAGILSGKPDSVSIRMPSFEGESRFSEIKAEKMVMHMDGQEVYKFAVNAMGHEIENVCQKAGIEPAEVDWFLPHQANVRIVDACQKKFKIEKSKVLMNIAEYGNMSATSIMVLLDEFAKKGTFHRGDKLLFVAFGGGLTSGALLIKWNKD